MRTFYCKLYIKYRFYAYRCSLWKKIVFGINNLFSVSIFCNGIIFTLCKPGTIFKMYDVSFEFRTFNFQVIKY